MERVRRLWPMAVLLGVLCVVWGLGLQRQLSWEAIGHNQHELSALVVHHHLLAPAVYIVVYAGAVALSLPGGAVLTVLGGLLFGTALGAVSAILGATIGATILFLSARHAFADVLARRAGGFIAKLRPGLERDGFSYLLALRLIPVCPFWLVNLAPALAGMPLAPYVAATLLGIVPASFVFASIGAGLHRVLEMGAQPDLGVVFSPPVLLPLVGLALISLLPVVWRQMKQAKGSNA
jgi:uncharacterized membrane protein YdjX (TVP38/TMEM64 family)